MNSLGDIGSLYTRDAFGLYSALSSVEDNKGMIEEKMWLVYASGTASAKFLIMQRGGIPLGKTYNVRKVIVSQDELADSIYELFRVYAFVPTITMTEHGNKYDRRFKSDMLKVHLFAMHYKNNDSEYDYILSAVPHVPVYPGHFERTYEFPQEIACLNLAVRRRRISGDSEKGLTNAARVECPYCRSMVNTEDGYRSCGGCGFPYLLIQHTGRNDVMYDGGLSSIQQLSSHIQVPAQVVNVFSSSTDGYYLHPGLKSMPYDSEPDVTSRPDRTITYGTTLTFS